MNEKDLKYKSFIEIEITDDFNYLKGLIFLIKELFSLSSNPQNLEILFFNLENYLKNNTNDGDLITNVLLYFKKIRIKQNEVIPNIFSFFKTKFPIIGQNLENKQFNELNQSLLSSRDQYEDVIKNDDCEKYQSLVTDKIDFDYIHHLQLSFDATRNFEVLHISHLDIAALYGSIDIFKYLIMNGSDMSKDIPSFAIFGGDFEIIRILEQKGISFNDKFYDSIRFHRYEISDWLLSNYSCEYVSLCSCINVYNYEAFLFLYLNGSDINEIDSSGLPLSMACASNNISLVKYICEFCNPNTDIVLNGKAPIHYACISNSLPIMTYLIEEQKVNKESLNGNKCTPLLIACEYNYIEIVKYLIEKQHVNKDAKNSKGRNALHIACWSKSLDIVKYLIEEQHFDPEVNDNDGMTPLHLACKRPSPEIVKYLIVDKNVNQEARDKSGKLPHSYAMQNGIDRLGALMEQINSKKSSDSSLT